MSLTNVGGDRRRYQNWKKNVLLPFMSERERHEKTLQQLGLSSEQTAQTKRQGQESNGAIGSMLKELLFWQRFAKQYCDTTDAEVLSLLGKRGLAQWLGQVDGLRRFLARFERARRYDIAMQQVSVQTFASKQTAAALCRKLRQGLREELSHLTRYRMEQFLLQVGIGGSEKRHFVVEPILEFARQRNLAARSPEQIYKAFVDQKMIDAEASDPSATMFGDLSEEQFELLPIAGADDRGHQGSLSESTFDVALSAERKLTADGTRLCKSKCVLDPARKRNVCRTDPYRYLGIEYDWDYC